MIGAAAGFLRARVSRRLFALFVVSAFLPLAAIALLSWSEVRGLLQQQGDQRLLATAKSYGMTLFERLSLAGEIASSAAQGGGTADNPMRARAFVSLAVVHADGTFRELLGRPDVKSLPPEARARLAAGKPAVLVTGGAAQPRIELAVPVTPGSPDHVRGEVKPEFLWGPADEFPAATDFCVVEDRWKTLLYCSAPMPEAALTGALTWRQHGDTYRSRTWAQFMRAGFGTPDWIIVASQPERVHFARAVEFARDFLPVVALTILLVTWLTIRQSRDIVGPLARLADRARDISRNEFGPPLALKRNDEFGALGSAFDNMSSRLDRQIASLNALAEIDRLILATRDTAEVIRTVLKRLAEIVPADAISATLFNHEDPDLARTYFLGEDRAEAEMVRRETSAVERALLGERSEPGWVELSAAGEHPAHLVHAAEAGARWAYVQPILWRGELCGAIVLGYRRKPESAEDERQQARELADRVAVAVSSAWRDQQLYVQAHFDTLTGAPNRYLFRDRLGMEIVRSEREGLAFALLFLDLDHFKNVNDTLGHSSGDVVLREAAARLQRAVRASDTVSRLGGDEFTVILTNLESPQEAWLVTQAVLDALAQAFIVDGQQVFLSASAGIASYPADGRTVEDLLKCADTAMYRAKASGRGHAVFFEERMNAEAVARVSLDRDLRVAIDRGELELHYQPQVDLRSGQIRGAEALVRWNHPSRGPIPPSRFIPLAEESGFIEVLGQWILREACVQARRWRDAGLGLDHVSVNVSPRQFRRATLADFIANCVRESGLEAAAIQIEITEGLLMDRGEAVEGLLARLAEAGHSIALDDFGTGFSSMAYLRRLPVNTLKVDRVFVDGLEAGGDAEAIVAGIIAMAHALGKVVIAEGAETEEQVARLRALRCDAVQGFAFAPALPPDGFEAFVLARRGAMATA